MWGQSGRSATLPRREFARVTGEVGSPAPSLERVVADRGQKQLDVRENALGTWWATFVTQGRYTMDKRPPKWNWQ
jgi:hypothetical protein